MLYINYLNKKDTYELIIRNIEDTIKELHIININIQKHIFNIYKN